MSKQLSLITILIMSLSLAGCSSVNVNINTKDSNDTPETSTIVVESPEEPMVGMANPWREISAEEAAQNPRMFVAPEGASNIVWRILDSAADEKSGTGELIELDFDIEDEYGSQSYNARYQYGADENDDISGMYYDWTVTDEGKLSNWGLGNMNAKFYRYCGEDEMADLCIWYDVEIGISYCLSTVAPDLDGFDIQGVVEAMYPGDDIYDDGSE